MEDKKTSSVHSVAKAMELIDLLLKHRAPLTLAELSERSGFPKSTTHALLSTLREYGMITQRNDGRYYLGLRLFECGCAVAAEWDISTVAPPYLEKLAAATGASAFISVIDNKTVVALDQCSGNAAFRVVPEIGCRLPLHATSQGKLLLSQFSDGEVLRRLEEAGMQAYTPHTITDPATLLAALHEIRDYGYAVENGEFKIGLRSVSAPVYDRDGRMRYAVGVVGLFRHVHSEEFEQATEQVLTTAQQISFAIGYHARGV